MPGAYPYPRSWCSEYIMPSFALRNPDSCRTKHAFGLYWWCLVDKKTIFCQYMLGFGNDYLCQHPECGDFAGDEPQ